MLFLNTLSSSSSLWAIPFTVHAEHLIIFCLFHFRLSFLATVRRQVGRPVLSLHCGLEVVLIPSVGLLDYRYVVQWWGCHLLASGQACSAFTLRMMEQ